MYDGELKDAVEIFEDEWRGAIKTPQSRWIDSICYHTMIGECYYHMGRLDEALTHYTAALSLYLAFPDWLIRVQFPPTIAPAQTHVYQSLPWGGTNRPGRPGRFPSEMLIGQGRINNNAVIQQGGVFQPAMLMPVQVQEIVRCTAVAIRRRTELLGPLSPHDPMTADLLAVLGRNPGLPNHWSQAWVDVQYAMALLAAGKVAEALPVLNRSLIVAGEYDHPLTPIALLELGRIALQRGDFDTASRLFHEATVAAVQFEDGTVLEEAFRYGALTHLVANRPGVFAELEPAAQWAKVKNLRFLRVSLLLSAAENLLEQRQTVPAVALLDEAQTVIGRREMGAGRIGARLQYLRAIALFQQGKHEAGEQALAATMRYMRGGSHWLFQIRQVDTRFIAGQITLQGPLTPRVALDVYNQLLVDPAAVDWIYRPMESLAVLTTPHSESMEHWFLVALMRNDREAALEIADRARRHRFFSTFPFGGRLIVLRHVLEAPIDSLSAEARLNRQDLLAHHPDYDKLSQQSRQLRQALSAMPIKPGNQEQSDQQRKLVQQWAELTARQELMLREMALRRHPAAMVFPPLRTTKELRERLPEGQAMLVFFVAKGDLYAFLINKENYDSWRLTNASRVGRNLVALLRSFGQYEANRELSLKEVEEAAWQKEAQELLASILQGSRADFAANFPELAIVPDGIMWYVPFESLVVEVDGQLRPLISRFAIRYAPLASLAVPSEAPRSVTGPTVVVLGRLYPQADDKTAQAAFDQLARVVPRAVSVPKQVAAGPTSMVAPRIGQLIVLDDLPQDAPPYGWSPIPVTGAAPGNTLADWIALPWGGPQVVILPGYHTAAETALRRTGPAAPGAEVFLSVCGLMSCGAQTILLSRWRTGGQTAFDMVREFAQELPYESPAEAYRRATLVVADGRLDLAREPRIKSAAVAEPPKAHHPFFWAGYMLIDSGRSAAAQAPAGEKAPGEAVPPAETKPPAEGEQPAVDEGDRREQT